MPPVTPSAMRAISTPIGVSVLYFDDLAAQDFLLRDGDLLVPLFPRHGAVEQLALTLAGEDDEFEPVFLGCWCHDVLSGGRPKGPPLRRVRLYVEWRRAFRPALFL